MKEKVTNFAWSDSTDPEREVEFLSIGGEARKNQE